MYKKYFSHPCNNKCSKCTVQNICTDNISSTLMTCTGDTALKVNIAKAFRKVVVLENTISNLSNKFVGIQNQNTYHHGL